MAASGTRSLDQAEYAKAQDRLSDRIGKQSPPEEFFREFLQESVAIFAGTAGAVWGVNRDGVFAPLAEVNLQEAGLKGETPAAKLHIQLLLHVLHTGSAAFCTVSGEGLAKSPCDATLLLVPLQCKANCLGVVELFLPLEINAEVATDILPALEKFSELASAYLASQIASHSAAMHDENNNGTDAFLFQLHRNLDLEQVAFTTVNEGRLYFGCDRVSLAILRAGKTRIMAVSGHERIVQRSTLVRSMMKVATLIAESGRQLLYNGASSSLPAAIEQPILEFLNESGSRQLQAVPLFEPEESQQSQDQERTKRPTVCGVLLLEHFNEEKSQSDIKSQQNVLNHVSLAIHNSLAFEQGFYHAVWQKLEKVLPRWMATGPRRLAILVTSVFAATGLLMLLPVSYRVEAQGVLVPVSRQGVFAPQEGNVVEVLVHGGEQVQQGQVLLRMRNDELIMEHLLVRNQLQEKKQLLAALRAESDGPDRSLNREIAIRLRGQLSKTQIELDGLEQRESDLEKSIAELEIKALISGTVASFQPQQQLLNRPVQKGEVLLELMAEQGPWKLELELPAHRIGHVQAAATALESKHLPVYFVTTTMPNERHLGYIRNLATRTSVADDQSAVVKVDVALDSEALPVRTAGAEVFARIGCGQRCLGYVLFGDITDFVSRRLW